MSCGAKGLAIFCFSASIGWAEPLIVDNFSDPAAWRYVSDQVMGGVSEGQAQFLKEGAETYVRLQGEVSTDNNGGFIQVRRNLVVPFAADSKSLALRLRGNGATYYVHLRHRDARRPWHYFAAEFATNDDWQNVRLPWSDFSAQGGFQAEFDPTEIVSVGLVAYGADYTAKLDVAQIAVE
ncbi:MAG: CIA30 family protein [Pseudomonadota bacterium]